MAIFKCILFSELEPRGMFAWRIVTPPVAVTSTNLSAVHEEEVEKLEAAVKMVLRVKN